MIRSIRFGTSNSGQVPRSRNPIPPFPTRPEDLRELYIFENLDKDYDLKNRNINIRKKAWKRAFRGVDGDLLRERYEDPMKVLKLIWPDDDEEPDEMILGFTIGTDHVELSDSEAELSDSESLSSLDFSEESKEVEPPKNTQEAKDAAFKEVVETGVDLKQYEYDFDFMLSIGELNDKVMRVMIRKRLTGWENAEKVKAEILFDEKERERRVQNREDMERANSESLWYNMLWRREDEEKRKEAEEKRMKEMWLKRQESKRENERIMNQKRLELIAKKKNIQIQEGEDLKQAIKRANKERVAMAKQMLLDKPYRLLPNELKADALSLAIAESLGHVYGPKLDRQNLKKHQWNRVQSVYVHCCRDLGLKYPRYRSNSRFTACAKKTLELCFSYIKTLSYNSYYYIDRVPRKIKRTTEPAHYIQKTEYVVKSFTSKYPIKLYQWYKNDRVKFDVEAKKYKKLQRITKEVDETIKFWESHNCNWEAGDLTYVDPMVQTIYVPRVEKVEYIDRPTDILLKDTTNWYKVENKMYLKPILSRTVARMSKLGLTEKRRKILKWKSGSKKTEAQRSIGIKNRGEAMKWLEAIEAFLQKYSMKDPAQSHFFEHFNDIMKKWAFKKNSWSYKPELKGRLRLKGRNYNNLLLNC